MHFKHLLKGLTIATPILATAVLTACHDNTNIAGKYVNSDNPKQILDVLNEGRYQDDKEFLFIESMHCGSTRKRTGVKLVKDKFITMGDYFTRGGDKIGSINGDDITIYDSKCKPVTYEKVQDYNREDQEKIEERESILQRNAYIEANGG